MTITKCGACIGCEIDASVVSAVADIDSMIMPKIEGATERYVFTLLEERSRLIGLVVRMFNPPECLAPRISVERVTDHTN